MLRGTIFCPQIKYTKEFVIELNKFLADYMPVLIVPEGNFLPVSSMWKMVSSDEQDVLLFGGEKVDIIRKVYSSVNQTVIVDFTEYCKLVFEKILQLSGYTSLRLALAPTILITENGERPNSLYDRLFSLREFQHSSPEISNVSQVFRVNKSICGHEVKVNHVANFHLENELVVINGVNQIKEYYLCDFDINTMANCGYKFDINSMKEFFDIAVTSFDDFYNLYFA